MRVSLNSYNLYNNQSRVISNNSESRQKVQEQVSNFNPAFGMNFNKNKLIIGCALAMMIGGVIGFWKEIFLGINEKISSNKPAAQVVEQTSQVTAKDATEDAFIILIRNLVRDKKNKETILTLLQDNKRDLIKNMTIERKTKLGKILEKGSIKFVIPK